MVPHTYVREDSRDVAAGEREAWELSGAGESEQARRLCALSETGGEGDTCHDKMQCELSCGSDSVCCYNTAAMVVSVTF